MSAPRKAKPRKPKKALTAEAAAELESMRLQESLGERIARRRRDLGWNQKTLAARVGCRPAQISKYERGSYEPKLLILSRIASALGTSIDFLVTGKEPRQDGPDLLLALWPSLEQLPLGLRNEVAQFLNTVLHAKTLLGLSEMVRQSPPKSSRAGKSRQSRAKRSR